MTLHILLEPVFLGLVACFFLHSNYVTLKRKASKDLVRLGFKVTTHEIFETISGFKNDGSFRLYHAPAFWQFTPTLLHYKNSSSLFWQVSDPRRFLAFGCRRIFAYARIAA